MVRRRRVSQKSALPLDYIENEDLVRKCPDCGSKDISHDVGEYYCSRCGMVLE